MASAPAGSGWTAGRIIALAAGSVLLVISLALIASGGTLAWADTGQLRSGYLTTSTATYSTSGYALTSDPVKLHGAWGLLSLLVDRVRIRIWTPGSSRPLFAGIGATSDVERYLAGVNYTTVVGDHDVTGHPGTRVPAAPAAALPWVAQAQGTGSLTLTWEVRDGDWTVVVMNRDASPGLIVRAEAGLSSLALPWLAGELLAAGVLLGLTAGALIIVPVRLASRPVP